MCYFSDNGRSVQYTDEFFKENREYFVGKLLKVQEKIDFINKGVYQGKFLLGFPWAKLDFLQINESDQLPGPSAPGEGCLRDNYIKYAENLSQAFSSGHADPPNNKNPKSGGNPIPDKSDRFDKSAHDRNA